MDNIFNQPIQSILVLFLVLQVIMLSQNSVEGSPRFTTDDTIVSMAPGTVRGTIMFSRSNRSFYAFKGIPYAKPPVDELRFRAPVPPNPWKGVLDATEDSSMCIQKNYIFKEKPPVEGREDCLYLNVYTPKLPSTKIFWASEKRKTFLPVMVFIHYGGFFSGTGNSDYLGPEYFMDEDVVLVTFNYRLGVFGFLSTDNDASPGNWGLKDQALVFKWVQDNVCHFGGDVDRVTIFGQSAGAGSVHYHLLSPLTRGLFHNAISQSGTSLGLWARPKNALQAEIAKQQAFLVGCDPDSDSFVMIECLRKIDATDLVESSDSFKFFFSEPFILFGPVIEKVTKANPEPYISEDPLDLIKKGDIYRVPWIVGVVSDEGILRASPLLRLPQIQSDLNKKFDEVGPQIFGIPLSVPLENVKQIWNKITGYFLGGNYVNITKPESVQGFINLYSDRAFNYPNYQSALLHAWKGHNPIWFYNFGYKGDYSYGEHFAITEQNIKFKWGVSHCDDLLYLFPSKKLFQPLKSENDILMSKIFIRLWTNFAAYGNPTPINDVVKCRWESLPSLEKQQVVKNSDLIYLNITGPYKSEKGAPIKLEMKNEFYPERMYFWESLPLFENINGIK